jgi:hypothetical protein
MKQYGMIKLAPMGVPPALATLASRNPAFKEATGTVAIPEEFAGAP